jgi:hypothetical protein
LAGCWWLVLIFFERKDLLAGCWFVLREKYCWLVADKPSEQGASSLTQISTTTKLYTRGKKTPKL